MSDGLKVLIIGASGLLGRAISRSYLEHGFEVWGAYHTNKQLLVEGCRPVSMNELETLKHRFKFVVLAAGNYALDPKDLITVNVDLSQRISSYFPGSKLIFVSSTSVYGGSHKVISDNSPFDNPSLYGLAKLGGELVTKIHPSFAIIRLTYLFGAGMKPTSFLPKLVENYKSSGLITLLGQGERLQDYLHVSDAAELCYRAGNHDSNGIYLGATGRSVSNVEIAKSVQTQVPDCSIEFSGEDTAISFRFDPKNTFIKLGWKPRKFVLDSLTDLL